MGKAKIVVTLLIAITATTVATIARAEGPCATKLVNLLSDKDWFQAEHEIAKVKLLENVSRPDTLPGTVVAATTKENPNYYYHWVRDAALVMDTVAKMIERSTDPAEKATLTTRAKEFIELSRRHQHTPTLTGLGEPKFEPDGRGYGVRMDDWGRPQNDGPALRAITIMNLSRLVDVPAIDVIKADLDYTALHWGDPSFDVWEEVLGDHFYNYMVSRKALIKGAEFFRKLGDLETAHIYESQAKLIEMQIIPKFWDAQNGHFIPTVNRVRGADYKTSGLDSVMVLALLHGGLDDGFLSFSDPKVLATMEKIDESFANLYPINQQPHDGMSTAIGRYPEDIYGGPNFSGGNPWILTTLAFGEAYFKAAAEFKAKGDMAKSAEMTNKAESYIRRVRYHTGAKGELSEQFSRYNGYMTSVENLTWSYSAAITAFMARPE